MSATRLSVQRRPLAIPLGCAVIALLSAAAAVACPAACDGHDEISISDVVRGVDIALGRTDASACRSLDRDGSGSVTVDELLAAVGAVLAGCVPDRTATATASATQTPLSSPTATASATGTPSATVTARPTESATPPPTATATASATPSASPTATFANQPPLVPPGFVYRTYPGLEIALPLAIDPEGGALECSADDLPAGAALDGPLLRWTPAAAQRGPFALSYSCADDGEPRQSSTGELLFKLLPPDPCARSTCTPVDGCSLALPPTAERCCGPALPRVNEPAAACPQGRVAFLGRNALGFGRLSNCDQMRVANFSQLGATVSFHVEARCLNSAGLVLVEVRMETATRLLVNAAQSVVLTPAEHGFARRRNIAFEVGGPAPFFDIEGAEANIRVTLTDSDGVSVTAQQRLRLTFTRLADLPEADQ